MCRYATWHSSLNNALTTEQSSAFKKVQVIVFDQPNEFRIIQNLLWLYNFLHMSINELIVNTGFYNSGVV